MSGPHRHDNHDHTDPPSELALRVQAFESLLIEKGLVNATAIDALIDTYETKVGLRNGVRVVARAWSNPAFKKWLLADATVAIAAMDYTSRQGLAQTIRHRAWATGMTLHNCLGRPGYLVRHNERGMRCQPDHAGDRLSLSVDKHRPGSHRWHDELERHRAGSGPGQHRIHVARHCCVGKVNRLRATYRSSHNAAERPP
jgi:hypothetical protein